MFSVQTKTQSEHFTFYSEHFRLHCMYIQKIPDIHSLIRVAHSYFLSANEKIRFFPCNQAYSFPAQRKKRGAQGTRMMCKLTNLRHFIIIIFFKLTSTIKCTAALGVSIHALVTLFVLNVCRVVCCVQLKFNIIYTLYHLRVTYVQNFKKKRPKQ